MNTPAAGDVIWKYCRSVAPSASSLYPNLFPSSHGALLTKCPPDSKELTAPIGLELLTVFELVRAVAGLSSSEKSMPPGVVRCQGCHHSSDSGGTWKMRLQVLPRYSGGMSKLNKVECVEEIWATKLLPMTLPGLVRSIGIRSWGVSYDPDRSMGIFGIEVPGGLGICDGMAVGVDAAVGKDVTFTASC